MFKDSPLPPISMAMNESKPSNGLIKDPQQVAEEMASYILQNYAPYQQNNVLKIMYDIIKKMRHSVIQEAEQNVTELRKSLDDLG